ncbi:MAG: ORF6N domain-containing protein [Candidatus Uhrbacteria bacterium]|nr:ORF6N domain-containing protein [Candidatus Uhrbacteria bacterium]
MPDNHQLTLPSEIVENKILLIRGRRIMIDRDLASLYQVKTKSLNQAVRRNSKRFPGDFMFRLNREEFQIWRSQFVTSKKDRIGVRRAPYAFTEQGVAMLSSVLNSERAILVNIQIMRTFTKLREMIIQNSELKLKLEALEQRYDEQFKVVFDAIRRLLTEEETPTSTIGFTIRDG